MNIIRISPVVNTVFCAKKPNKMSDISSKDIYKNIDSFLKKEISKEEYLKNVNQITNSIFRDKHVLKSLSRDEHKYISDMRTSIFSANKLRDISDEELELRIKQLFKDNKINPSS